MKKYSTLLLAGIVAVVLGGCNQNKGQQAGGAPASSSATAAVSPLAASDKPQIAREPAQNAAPLGVEVGYANMAGVKEKLGSVTTLQEQGINQFSDGPMLASNGEGLGVDGMTHVLFIFDKKNVLAGVVMTLPKGPKNVFAKLSTKYKESFVF